MSSFALFGDSYITRLGKYCQYDLKVPGEVRFFGRGGAKINPFPDDLWQEMMQYRPQVVFWCLGGNSISETSRPGDIVRDILYRTDLLKAAGVKKIYIAEISERGEFSKSPGLTKTIFDDKRKVINRRLRQIFKDDFLTFKDIKYPADYNKDLVHFGSVGDQKGLKKFFFAVRRLFLAYK